MKKIFTLSLGAMLSASSFAQIGATAPNFTVTDINGAPHTLYDYLNDGKVVLLDVSATWCGPCWGFHSAHYLEDLYTEFGPAGTDQVVVLFYEGDAATDANDLNGTDASSQGDWVTGSPYPIVNESPIQLNLNIFAPLGFPTINVICPSDKKIKADLWDLQAGTQAASLAAMRAFILETHATCNEGLSIENELFADLSLSPNPTKDKLEVTSSLAGDVKITVYSIAGAVLNTTSVSNYSQSTSVDVSNLAAGSYFLQLTQGETKTKMIEFLKF